MRKKKAQQLVEFLLVAPLLIIFLGIVTEYAYALNINMTLTKALKTVTAELYSEIKPSMTKDDITDLVNTNLNHYLDDNNVPINSENKINAGYVECGTTAIFMARYTYITAFTLPNVFFKFLPDQFDFLATAAVPSALLAQNNYNSTINSLKLDKIWSASADFSSEDGFNAAKKGIMKDSTGRNNILFLVPTTAAGLTTPYALVNWDSTLKKVPILGWVYTFDMNDGGLYFCSATNCAYSGTNLYNYLTSNNYYNLFFVPSDGIPANLNTLNSVWLNPNGTTDISETTTTGILKDILSVSKNNLSIGNYDNIDVTSYNFGVSRATTYKMKSYGSFVVVYSSEDISKMNATVKSKNYNFGS